MHKIMVVDDEPITLEAIEIILNKNGFHVDAYSSSKSAYEGFCKNEYELILSDFMMPEINGVELLKLIRKKNKEIPFIFITGKANTHDALELMEQGGSDYISKPINAGNLLFRIKKNIIETQNEKIIKSINDSLKEEIEERIKSELETREANIRFLQLFKSIKSILIGLSKDKEITEFNPTAEFFFNIKADDIIGKKIDEIDINLNWNIINTGIAYCISSGESIKLEDINYIRNDGQKGIFGFTLSTIKNEKEERIGIIVLGAEISKRKQMEARFAQAQKLESIGQLAAGIAHEINSPIQYVGDNIHFLKDGFSDLVAIIQEYQNLTKLCEKNEKLAEKIKIIREKEKKLDTSFLIEEIPRAIDQSLDGVNRVTKIVKSMRDFSHPHSDDKKDIDLNKAIESTINISTNEWKYVADVKTDFDENMPFISCYPGELNQVFLNMIVNAAHAIESVKNKNGEKGTITITTQKNNQFAEISIMDTGTGMPDEVKEKIFDPFFTTKDVGKGTGQGLAISHSVIVEKHKGTIDVVSVENKGTKFIIRIPIK